MVVRFALTPEEADITDVASTHDMKGKQPHTPALNESGPPQRSPPPQTPPSPQSWQAAQQQRLQQLIQESAQERPPPSFFGKLLARPRAWVRRRLETGPHWLNVVVAFRTLSLGASIGILTLVVILAAADGIFCWGWLVASIVSLLADFVGASLPLFIVEDRFPAVVVLTVLDVLAAVLFSVFAVRGVPQVRFVGANHALETEGERNADLAGNGLVSVLSAYAPSMM